MNLESVLDRTRQILRRKHYSWNTEKVYCQWIERYGRYVRKLPKEFSFEQKLERFLTCIARRDCSASPQNQAFNAILFLYKEVLERPLGNIRALRAREKPRVITAPSRDEVARIFSEVESRVEEKGDYPLRLIVKLLYGCGLRVTEPLNLRIKDVQLENQKLVIREAKGGKDRVVPLPASLVPAIREQIKHAQAMWMRDRQNGIPVPLPGALDRKYPNGGKSWAWYWLFPAHRPCKHPRTGRIVRWRCHEVNVQRAVREAAKKCCLESAVTPHVLRHAFATHALQLGANVRDVQEILGHASIETTMRYLHAATDRVKSPLDTLPEALPAHALVPELPKRGIRPADPLPSPRPPALPVHEVPLSGSESLSRTPAGESSRWPRGRQEQATASQGPVTKRALPAVNSPEKNSPDPNHAANDLPLFRCPGTGSEAPQNRSQRPGSTSRFDAGVAMESGRMPPPAKPDGTSIPAKQLGAASPARDTTQSRIRFEAFDVSGAESGDFFQVQLSREKEDPLTFSFKNHDWNAPYLLIQRSFENYDQHWYVETHRPEMSGHCRWIQMSVRGDTLHARWSWGEATVRMRCSEQELQEFTRVLRIIVPEVEVREGAQPGLGRTTLGFLGA